MNVGGLHDGFPHTRESVLARIWGISDLHVDYADNFRAIEQWSDWDFQQDTLLVAGDLSDKLELIGRTLAACRKKYACVSYVPGNHEMWMRGATSVTDSLDKWQALRNLCLDEGITLQDFIVSGRHPATVVPLLSWYETATDHAGTLYIKKGDRDETRDMWMDFHLTRWPGISNIADYFLQQNAPLNSVVGDVITFSHFLPRKELMFSSARIPPEGTTYPADPHPEFNFSHVAGTHKLDAQLRQRGSVLHLYGHQHRNRAVIIEGVLYVSHCMGYPRERARGYVKGSATLPRCLWDTDIGVTVLS